MRYLLPGTALLVLLLSGCGSSSQDGVLRVQVFTGAYSSIPVHVADELGFFAKHGLIVEKLPANSSSAALAAMIGGSLDVVESAADLVMANIDKGTELRYLMSNEGTNYVNVVVGNHVRVPGDARDYRNVFRALSGHRIGVNAIGSTVYLAAVMMIEDAGVDKDDVEFVATGSAATTMSAWQSGSVDAQVTFAPVPELLETLGVAEPYFVLADDGPLALRFDGLYGGWVTTAALLESRSDDADAFIAAVIEAIDWIRSPDNQAELLEIARRHAPVSALSPTQNDVVLQKMIDRYRRFWGYEISRDAIDKWNDYALHFGLVSKPIGFEQIVYSGAPVCEESPCQ
ncbi:MAG: ABC transporter substrate-binding protein [Gammaproteobacteria bacterium]|nr:ABC transporter substrate-binding protein [Gammaproteobacteria bacterium]